MSHVNGTATDYLDLLNKLDAYLTVAGHAWAKLYAGVGNGEIIDYIGTSTSVAETFTITATSATNFTVVGSTSGAAAAATVGTPYASANINFKIVAGATPFVSGDQFKLTTSPKWTRERAEGCADQSKRTTNMANVENAFDGNVNTFASRAATTATIDFDMNRDSEVREFVLACNAVSNSPRDFRLQWKALIGDAWTTAQSWTGVTWGVSNEAHQYNLTSAPGAHRFWRFEVQAVNGTTVDIGTLDLHAKPGDSYSLSENFNLVWKAPGLDGTKSIYIGLQTYGSANSDTWNLGFTGFRAVDLTAGVAAQPNASGQTWLALINSSISYWFVVNGQRAIVVAKLAGGYQIAYLGFGLPYEPPSVHEFPHIIGASGNNRTRRYDSQQGNFRFPMDPGEIGMSAFYPDAQWRNHVNRFISGTDTTEGNLASAYGGKVWPAALSGSTEALPKELRENIDGSRPLLPGILYHYLAPVHAWGEFDGLYWTSGFGTVAEATIREGGFDHLIVNNIFRTTTQNYAAVRLD
jgi:hypothetical protein